MRIVTVKTRKTESGTRTMTHRAASLLELEKKGLSKAHLPTFYSTAEFNVVFE